MFTDEHNDENLFFLLKEGNPIAYKKIYDRYKYALYIHAYRMLKDEEEAKDLIQELFVVLWDKRESIDVRMSLSAYLYGAVKNRVLDLIAHKKIRDNYEVSLQSFLTAGNCITDYALREKELSSIIEREIAYLPSKMRNVFELSRNEHLSYKEIAAKLDISDKTVKKQVNNAIKILRLKLGSLYVFFLL
jgi:RNA polymerase sigma-70 factor (ECF subfamily)